MEINKIIQGDALEKLTKLREKFNDFIIVTDPPFNIGKKYNVYEDDLSDEEYFTWLKEIFGSDDFVVIHYPEEVYKISFEVGKFPERVVSWVYNSNTKRQHRDVAFFGIKPDFSQVKQPYKNQDDKRIKKLIKEGKKGADLYDWWQVNQVKNVSKEKTEHPCQMPLKVMENIISILPKDKLIIDPFCGTGTTLIACKKLGRDFIGIELDPKYIEIAKDRLAQKTLDI